jgi:hypothetical protein
VTRLRQLAHRAVPSHFEDPVGLTVRLLRSGSREAYFAMLSAALGLAATPVDIALGPFERRRYRRAVPPAGPLVLVCGPPRSGTTIVAQALIRCLPVTYLNNLTALFPRAPITANRLLGTPLRNHRVGSVSHYGRTAGLSGPNDGLHLWDRWLGPDRTAIREALTAQEVDGMARFFGAWERTIGTPLVAKNNNLNVQAGVVAKALPTALFLCLDRDPLYLAQSLLVARRYIHGQVTASYGIAAPGEASDNPIDDVCRQVAFHTDMAEQHRRTIGDDRFWLVSYESFCASPGQLVRRVAKRLGVAPEETAVEELRLRPSAARTLDPEEFAQLEHAVARTVKRSPR